jgi:type IV pilus biogenesis protein CpaD/CtpE
MISLRIRHTFALIVAVTTLMSACGTLSENAVPDDSRTNRLDRIR